MMIMVMVILRHPHLPWYLKMNAYICVFGFTIVCACINLDFCNIYFFEHKYEGLCIATCIC